MSNLIPGNQKHLSLQDRLYIEKALSEGTSFKDIARFLCKDPSTISKEVKKHRLSDWYHKGTFYNAHNFCIHRYHCRKNECLWQDHPLRDQMHFLPDLQPDMRRFCPGTLQPVGQSPLCLQWLRQGSP